MSALLPQCPDLRGCEAFVIAIPPLADAVFGLDNDMLGLRRQQMRQRLLRAQTRGNNYVREPRGVDYAVFTDGGLGGSVDREAATRCQR
jgi:hypothetical protein